MRKTEKRNRLTKYVCLSAVLLVLPHTNVHAEDILIEEGNCGPAAKYAGYDTDGDGAADKLVISGEDRIWDWSIQDHLWRSENGAKLEARTVVIEDGITQIGACENPMVKPQGAFSNLGHLTSITIPDSVTIIGENTFYNCTSLADITIPDSVKRIKYSAFENCLSLAHVTIPDGVSIIEENTFRHCPNLKAITIPGSVTSIGKHAFDATGLAEVTIPGSVTSIGEGAFHDCLDLKKVTVLNNEASIGEIAFGYKRPEGYWGTYLDKSVIPVDGFTVCGYAGGAAERYVERANRYIDIFTFTALDDLYWHGDYWYENGVLQGVRYNEDGSIDLSYRGKEIFDPATNAWYWLDNVQGGAMARSKDVYQESAAGEWAECADGTGKWVRYDKDGHMVKGWDENSDGMFYFDLQYGTMAKGYATIGNMEYYFNMETGVLERSTRVPEYGFAEVDGKMLYFQQYKRKGYSAHNKDYRGEELTIGGPWFWFENANDGEMARSKDVYHPESGAEGQQVHTVPTEGKWVRYDTEGRMMIGWVAGKGKDAVSLGIYAVGGKGKYLVPFDLADGRDLYFFDTQTGAMAKGDLVLDGITYHFDEVTGILDMP